MENIFLQQNANQNNPETYCIIPTAYIFLLLITSHEDFACHLKSTFTEPREEKTCFVISDQVRLNQSIQPYGLQTLDVGRRETILSLQQKQGQ